MKKLLYFILELLLVVLIATAGINLYMVKKEEDKIISLEELKDEYDAILVLGCKIEKNGPSMMLSKRLDKGIETYKQINSKLLLSGDHGQKEYDEVNVMRDYVLKEGIDTKDIFLDHAGFSTYDSIYRAKNVFGAKKIVIVTQRFHLYRALYIAEKLGLDAVGIRAEDVPYQSVMIRNELREVLSRDKNFIKVILEPESKYVGDAISLDGDGNVTTG